MLNSGRSVEGAKGENTFVGDGQCQGCHVKEYADWKTSDHFKAMLPATDSTVLGDFNNATFTADGVTTTFYRKGASFFIRTKEPDSVVRDYKVLYSFGHYPLQQYLVAFPGGRMQVPRVSWDSREKKWFHQYEGQEIAATDWLHWSQPAQNWNTMCATCHSTNLKKNYYLEADSFHTTWTSINVSCESCHGPGEQHVSFINSSAHKKGDRPIDTYIASTRGQYQQLNACTPCHALKADISSELISSGELLDDHIPQIASPEHFYGDGQIKGEVYIYTSFMQSKMKHQGVTCTSCHNPHSGKRLFAGNSLCTQCHRKTYDSPSHTFHQVNTKASDCVSCHMPGKTYMGNDYRHDHSFRVPRPDQSVLYGTPNACNACHMDKSTQWAADAIRKNYGPERKYHYSDDLLPGSRLDAASEAHLLKLVRDTATPSIIRATALSYLGSIFTDASAATLRGALQDSDALTRYHALRSLANFPSQQWLEAAGPLLSDKVRTVRIAAADLYLSVPAERIPERIMTAFYPAQQELRSYVLYQADFADGNVMIGDHYLKQNDFFLAEKFYLRALRKDSLLNYSRLNLAVAQSAQGKGAEALKVLRTAARIAPENDRVFYNLALLHIEMKDTASALASFEKAVRLKSTNPRLYYNYGLLLYGKRQAAKAADVLKKGIALNPNDEDLNYTLAYVYLQEGQHLQAKKHILLLRQVNPTNPRYQSLWQMLP
jgi:tetratricopeptide (TPR) repeat protein